MNDEQNDIELPEIEATCLAGHVHATFLGLTDKSNGDTRVLHDAWRTRLGARDDELLYEALALVRRSILALSSQVATSGRIGSLSRPGHETLIAGLLHCTSLTILHQQVASVYQYFNPDRLHALLTLADLLRDENPRPVLPKAIVEELIAMFRKIREDVVGLPNLPEAFRNHLFSLIDRLIWALSMANTLGPDVIVEAVIRAYTVMTNSPSVPETAAAPLAAVSDELLGACRRVMKVLDACHQAMNRAKAAGWIGIGLAGLLSSSAH